MRVLSIKKLKRQQADRVQSQMEVWGPGKRREIAELLSQGFMREVRWPTPVFLPGDSFQVMCNGPSFGMLDDLGSIAVIQQFEEHYGARIPNSFWAGREHATFGEIVEALKVVVAPGPAWIGGSRPTPVSDRAKIVVPMRPFAGWE